MKVYEEIKQALKEMGKGKGAISPSVYDMTWIARLNEDGIPVGGQAVEWLRENQLDDGSWGEPQVPYHHERLVCTLAASVALARQGDTKDQSLLQQAKGAIDEHAHNLEQDPVGETIGFEMIVPTLLKEAQELDLINGGHSYLNKLIKKRQAKIAALPNGFVNRDSTVIFSAEMIQGSEHSLLDVDNMQEANGSIGCSPAATAWFFKNVSNNTNDKALNFLEKVIGDEGTAPYIVPIDVFEIAWSLWNIALIEDLNQGILELCNPLLDFLTCQWSPQGLSAVSEFPVPDGDTTAVVHEVMTKFGQPLDIEGLLSFQGKSYFHCYEIEANSSISTNVHVLGALLQADHHLTHSGIDLVRKFLEDARVSDAYWDDKWHISPYYTTSHAVIASTGLNHDFAEPAVEWLINTQHKDGGWGHYMPTPEETAYAIQALAVWRKSGGKVPKAVLSKGKTWLQEHADDSQPLLWVGKSLYQPTLVIRTAILSALALAEKEL